MRVWAPEKGRVKDARGFYVCHEPALSAKKSIVFDPLDTLTDEPETRSLRGVGHDAVPDVFISRTAVSTPFRMVS